MHAHKAINYNHYNLHKAFNHSYYKIIMHRKSIDVIQISRDMAYI